MSSAPPYAAIIDAGSSSSRLFIYQWQSEIGLGEPLRLKTAFPSTSAEKKASVASGGIQHHEKRLAAYLGPVLLAGQTFLQDRNISNVPIYLLATGGMRESLSLDSQNVILREAHRVMNSVQGTFSVGQWDTNARVIPGNVEGLYGWVALNYGRDAEEQISGLLELGGSSMQITYKVPNSQLSKERVCLLSGNHRVFSQSWDGFGADSTHRRMLAMILKEAGGSNGTGVIRNPCLPEGQAGAVVVGSNRTTVGSGEFATCLRLSQSLLKDGLQTRDTIPSYLDIASFSKHFFGISNYWYNYQFFAKWGAYDARRAYDRKAFLKAVNKYCTSSWADIPWAVGDPDRTSAYTLDRCFHTAWMLTLLHDDEYGFGLEMTQYDTWNSLLRFPTTTDLASRSSWTIGAAALIARHDNLTLCSTLVQDANTLHNNTLNITSVAPPPVSAEAACELAPQPVTSHEYILGAYSFTITAYGLVLILLVIVGCQRRQIYAARRSLELPIVMDKNSS